MRPIVLLSPSDDRLERPPLAGLAVRRHVRPLQQLVGAGARLSHDRARAVRVDPRKHAVAHERFARREQPADVAPAQRVLEHGQRLVADRARGLLEVEDRDVGLLAGLERADPVLEADAPGRVDRRHAQRGLRRDRRRVGARPSPAQRESPATAGLSRSLQAVVAQEAAGCAATAGPGSVAPRAGAGRPLGRRSRTSSAPASATAAAAVRPMPRASVNAWPALSASSRPAPPPTRSAIACAAPIDSPAAPGASVISREYAVPMIEPMTATPSAPPTWRVTSLIAEPTPALASGTALITESVAGAIAAPIDSARPNETNPRSTGAMSGVHARLVLRTIATPMRPPAMTRARPRLEARRLEAPAPTTSPSASGNMAAPASSAVKPCANCRNCVNAKTEPIIAKKTSPTPREATVNRASRKNPSGSIGDSALRSHMTKATARTAADAKEASTTGSVQPRGVASMIPYTRVTSIAIERLAPRRSNAPGRGSRLSGTSANPATMAATTIGTLSQNTELQENHSSSRPPTNGPSPMPTPAIADQMPIALPRSSRGKTSMITDSVAGMIIAPPMPIAARSTISCVASWANAARTLATPNSTSPD